MRKLASIQRILNIKPIPDADSIEVATVLGWHVVTKKNEFKIGDLVCYVEIDSILPDRPEFEFMRQHKFRVRTIRLRGQISQGIIFPLSIIPQCNQIHFQENQDVTELLNITKYEPPIPASISGLAKGTFPSFIPKTDEPRVQICQELLDKYNHLTFTATEKLDGSSTTIYLNNDTFGVCSRNLELKETPDNTIWTVARSLKLEEILRDYNETYHKNIALQGELIGSGIQSNKYKFPQNTWKLYIFNIYDIDNGTYYNNNQLFDFCSHYHLLHVPIYNPFMNISTMSIDDLIFYADKIKTSITKDTQAEGIVLRPQQEIIDPKLGRVSFKVINNSFLLKHKE